MIFIKNLVVFIVLLWSFPLLASYEFGLGYEMRYQKNELQNMAEVHPMTYLFEYRSSVYGGRFEYNTLQTSDGNSALFISTRHDEIWLWGLWSPAQFSYATLYLSGGLGYYEDTVETRLMGVNSTDRSQKNPLVGFGIGADTKYKFLSFGAEARLIDAPKIDSSPLASLLFRLGFLF